MSSPSSSPSSLPFPSTHPHQSHHHHSLPPIDDGVPTTLLQYNYPIEDFSSPSQSSRSTMNSPSSIESTVKIDRDVEFLIGRDKSMKVTKNVMDNKDKGDEKDEKKEK